MAALIGTYNRIDSATLSGGSWVSTLPLSNLKNRVLGKVARTTNTALASTSVSLDLGSHRRMDVAALVNHNISLDGQIRIRGSNEVAATNQIRNNTMVGSVNGVIGSGGVLPTNWTTSLPSNGVSLSVTKGVEGNITYLDLRIFGTPSAGFSPAFRLEALNTAAAVPAENWALSMFCTTTGAAPPIVMQLRCVGSDGSTVLSTSTVGNSIAPTTGVLEDSRYSGVGTTVASTAYVTMMLTTVGWLAAGQAYDFTLRVGLPQMEKQQTTSAIPTSGAAITRAAGYMDAWQSYSYDSDWVDVWPTVYDSTKSQLEWEDVSWWKATYSPEEIEGYTPTICHIIEGAPPCQYWRIDISDVGNAAGYIQLGRVFIGPAWQPERDAEVGLTAGWETNTTVQKALSGTKYYQRRNPYRVTKFSFNVLSEDEAMSQAFEIDRRTGIDGEVLWIQNDQDTVHALRRRFLGTLRELTPIEFPYAGIGRKGYVIEEVC